MHDIFVGIQVILIFLGIFSPIIIIGLVVYLKKRLEHKQIMAAIEKGIPLSEFRSIKKASPPGPLWIKNLTAGIASLIIAAAIVCLRLVYIKYRPFADFDQTLIYLFIAAVFLAVGISRLVRGILQRRAERQNLLNGNNGVIENADTASKTPAPAQGKPE